MHMSEQQNKDLIQSVYDAFGSGEIQTILGNLADDVTWTLEGPSIIPFTGKRKGVVQVKQFFEILATTQTNQKLTMEPLIAQGDQVAGVGRYAATVTATGKRFDTPVSHFFTIRNGKIARFVDVIETATIADAYRAVAAAGR
jgi:ketosteroid isomerase-like protein